MAVNVDREKDIYMYCASAGMPEGEKNWGFMPVVKGGHNLPPLVGIGLTDLPNIWGGAMPLRPSPHPVPASLHLICLNKHVLINYAQWKVAYLVLVLKINTSPQYKKSADLFA